MKKKEKRKTNKQNKVNIKQQKRLRSSKTKSPAGFRLFLIREFNVPRAPQEKQLLEKQKQTFFIRNWV